MPVITYPLIRVRDLIDGSDALIRESQFDSAKYARIEEAEVVTLAPGAYSAAEIQAAVEAAVSKVIDKPEPEAPKAKRGRPKARG